MNNENRMTGWVTGLFRDSDNNIVKLEDVPGRILENGDAKIWSTWTDSEGNEYRSIETLVRLSFDETIRFMAALDISKNEVK